MEIWIVYSYTPLLCHSYLKVGSNYCLFSKHQIRNQACDVKLKINQCSEAGSHGRLYRISLFNIGRFIPLFWMHKR